MANMCKPTAVPVTTVKTKIRDKHVPSPMEFSLCRENKAEHGWKSRRNPEPTGFAGAFRELIKESGLLVLSFS